MITGVVKADEGRIRLKLIGFRGRKQDVEAVIDTGYTGSLTLPPLVVAALGLRWRSTERFTWLTEANAFSTCSWLRWTGTAKCAPFL
jgi:predicted aspartyl protease